MSVERPFSALLANGLDLKSLALLGRTHSTGWDFAEEFPEKFRKDPGNALRAFPGIPLKSTAGIPQARDSRHLRLPEHLPARECPKSVQRVSPEFQKLETDLASRWEGIRLPRAFWEVPGLPRKFPKLPRKFFGDFPGSSLTVEPNSNPGVPRKFPRLPRKFPGLSRKFPGLPRRSAPFFGKPDTLSRLAKTFSAKRCPELSAPRHRIRNR